MREGSAAATAAAGSSDPEGSDISIAATVLAAAFAPPLDRDAVRRVTGLHHLHVEDVLPVFADACRSRGALTRAGFAACFQRLRSSGLLPTDSQELPQHLIAGQRTSPAAREGYVHYVVCRLFDAFDRDGDGLVDIHDITSGLTTLCDGDHEAKIRAAFTVYDIDGDGHITQREMRSFLTSMYTMGVALGEHAIGDVPVEALAHGTTAAAFNAADLNSEYVLVLGCRVVVRTY